MTTRPSVAQLADRAHCPDCDQRLTLLVGRDCRGPMFYICRCGFIGQAGVGVLQHGKKERP